MAYKEAAHQMEKIMNLMEFIATFGMGYLVKIIVDWARKEISEAEKINKGEK